MGTMAGELPRVVPQLQHVRLLAHFGAHFGTRSAQEGAKMSPRGPSGASKSQKTGFSKTLKNRLFFQVFANAGFWVLEALNGPLGLILALSWADLVPKWSPKWPPK